MRIFGHIGMLLWEALMIGFGMKFPDAPDPYPDLIVWGAILGLVVWFGLWVFLPNKNNQQKNRIEPQIHLDERPTNKVASWNDWRATKEFINVITDLQNGSSRIKIIYFHQPHFPFAERLAAAFELAGWNVNFNKTAQGPHMPHHYCGGVEVKGRNRHLVETIATRLEQSGCVGIKMEITTNNIGKDNPKYPLAQNSIRITVGYEE